MTESFTITRTLAAPPELVWDVWTKPEHFAVWFGTEAVEVPLDSVTLDVRVGGKLAVQDGTVLDDCGGTFIPRGKSTLEM